MSNLKSQTAFDTPPPAASFAPEAMGPLELAPAAVPGLVFTCGCFDLLHMGHIRSLRYAKSLGSRLIVGLNSDESVRRLKGLNRPIRNQWDRLETLEAVRWVDEVILFHEDTPCALIERLKPSIIVKGPGYTTLNTPEASIADAYGGRTVICDSRADVSSTALMDRILTRSASEDLRVATRIASEGHRA